MALISDTLPYTDIGALMGGVKKRVVEIMESHADLLREASQAQSIVQSGRAFSGAQVTNELTQTENIEQSATAESRKEIEVEPAEAPPPGMPPGFHFNFIEELVAQLRARALLARSMLKLQQQQQVAQIGFAAGLDFEGNPSVVTNTLTQEETVAQTAVSQVSNNVVMKRDPDTENSARSREVEATIEGTKVIAGSAAVQTQGVGPQDTSSQVGRADGGIVKNTLVQKASASQTNQALMENTIDMREDSASATLSPRSTSVKVVIKDDKVQNYSSVVQAQGLVQIAEGGVDEEGHPTENGGNVSNVAHQSMDFTENSTAQSTLTVLI